MWRRNASPKSLKKLKVSQINQKLQSLNSMYTIANLKVLSLLTQDVFKEVHHSGEEEISKLSNPL